MRPGARGDLTLPDGETRSKAIVWSRTGRGSYMPTPLIYNGLLYVLGNNGVFDAYNVLLVVAAGPEFRHIATNSMGELLMATPALSDGVMYVRSSASLFAIGRKQ